LKNLLEKLFQTNSKNGNTKKPNKAGYIIILGLAGLLFIILGNVFSSSNEATEIPEEPPNNETQQEPEETGSQNAGKTDDINELQKNYEQDLEDMINKVQGVSEAEVMVNLESTREHVYEKNLIKGTQTTDESDSNGGTRDVEDIQEETQVVLVRQGDKEVPLLVQTKQPEVRGVFVVANGAENPTIEQAVMDAVSSVLAVPTYRISVMPKD